MATLNTCIKHLEHNLKHYSALYSKDDLDKAKSTLDYLKELLRIKGLFK